ncbi:MAG: hypothetical protein Q7R35_00255 [Elusimicrobiota bacterium]|nr:hypothetical protein [Elusimicrobiota bacterium]
MYNLPMDGKILRLLISIFSGLIVVFALLILVNYVGSLSGSRAELPGQEEAGGKLPDAGVLAQQALAAAKAGGGGRASMVPGPRHDLSTAAVNSQGAIMIVKVKDFSGVGETPQDMMAMLNEMGGGSKKKPAPIALKDSDLDKKIRNLGYAPAKEPSLKVSSMPEMGRRPGEEGVTLFTAPVEYKIYKSSENWWAFANSHKCRSAMETGAKPLASPLSSPDFSKESVLVLISVSELPNGIFKIIKFEKNGQELLVSYRVDPLAMAAGGGTDQHDFYSAAVIPKISAVKLIQAP